MRESTAFLILVCFAWAVTIIGVVCCLVWEHRTAKRYMRNKPVEYLLKYHRKAPRQLVLVKHVFHPTADDPEPWDDEANIPQLPGCTFAGWFCIPGAHDYLIDLLANEAHDSHAWHHGDAEPFRFGDDLEFEVDNDNPIGDS